MDLQDRIFSKFKPFSDEELGEAVRTGDMKLLLDTPKTVEEYEATEWDAGRSPMSAPAPSPEAEDGGWFGYLRALVSRRR